MHCGCPAPGQTFVQKLKQLASRRPTFLPRFLSPSDHTDSLNATHPSEHPVVHASFLKWAKSWRTKRREKVLQRHTRDAVKMAQGKIDQETYQRGDSHQQPFITPIITYNSKCAPYHGEVNNEETLRGACTNVSCSTTFLYSPGESCLGLHFQYTHTSSYFSVAEPGRNWICGKSNIQNRNICGHLQYVLVVAFLFAFAIIMAVPKF